MQKDLISFVCWSRSDELFRGLVDSLQGMDGEIIRVGQEFDSMAKAYNHGTSLARGGIIVYLHEDVRLYDKRFPELVAKALAPGVGFAGPVGSIYASPKFWWDAPQSSWRGWLLAPDRNDPSKEVLDVGRPYDGPAMNLDGLMMCTRERFVFPEELPGIHFLDQWMCREAESKGLTNAIFSVALKHLSWGEQDPSKCESNYAIYKRRWFEA